MVGRKVDKLREDSRTCASAPHFCTAQALKRATRSLGKRNSSLKQHPGVIPAVVLLLVNAFQRETYPAHRSVLRKHVGHGAGNSSSAADNTNSERRVCVCVCDYEKLNSTASGSATCN